MSRFRPARILFALVWLMFVVKALVYVVVTPLWEGFDELFHFAYIQSLSATHSLPVWGETFVDSDVAQSAAYVPLPVWMPQLAPGFEKLSYRDYWQMDEKEREEYRENLYQLNASAKRLISSSVPLYQIQHPPLYYALCAPIYKLMDGRNIVAKVYAIRVFSVLLASICVVAAALTAREKVSPLNSIFLALVALWPCLYIDIARVANDSLGVAVFSLVFCCMIRYATRQSPGRAVVLGVLLGLGLLTKAYFLASIPAIVLFTIVLACIDKDNGKRILRGGCVILFCAGVVGGWWYLRNYHLYGSFSGLQETLYFPSVGFSDRIRAALEVPWVPVAKHLFVTFCWVNGWSFLHLPKLPHLVFIILFVVAAFGLAKMMSPGDGQKAEFSRQRNAFVAAVCLAVFFALGVAYHEVNAYATMRSIGGPGGWYFYALVVPISFLVSLGVWGAGPKFARRSFVVMFFAILVVEVYGLLLVLTPYYTGIALPDADGWGIRFVESPTLVFSGETVTRLLANKPDALSSCVLAILVVAYFTIQIAVLLSVVAGASDTPSVPETASQGNSLPA